MEFIGDILHEQGPSRCFRHFALEGKAFEFGVKGAKVMVLLPQTEEFILSVLNSVRVSKCFFH